MNKKLTILLAAALTAAGASGQTTTRLSASKANDYGIVYSLPQTAIDITLEAECTVSKPGEFYNYAARYLGAAEARKAVKSASTQWRLIGATMSPRGEIATGAEQWLMQFKGGSPVFVELAAEGMPLAISTEAPAPAPAPARPEERPLSASPLDNQAARHAVTEDMLQSSSLAKRAQLAADQIMQLRQSRQDYLTGQADNMPDGKALELILANINAQEEALTAMFLGTTQTRTAVRTVSFVPGPDTPGEQVIARISATKGFVDSDDLSGEPVYLTFKVTDRGTYPTNEKGEEKKFPKGGVAYRIPGAATFGVEFRDKTFASEGFNIAQLGIVYGLDPAFFTNKKEPGYATFDPTTGALLQTGTLQE